MAITLLFSSAPYPGLRSFRYEESDIFFGRERQTDQLLARLASNRFLAVTGPSGCGKSSLIKAGLIPALQAGFMAEVGSRWRICVLRPGEQPFRRLARALASPDILGTERVSKEAAGLVQAALRRGPLGLIEVVRGAEELRGATLLIVVDQFEEIFRYRERIAADEADAFVSLLLANVGQTEMPIYVVITMRSDYLGDCTVFHGLPEAVSSSQYLTPRLSREELALAIGGPARVFGGEVEPKLLNRLLNDFGTDPDQLPLLQHALARLWSRCSARSVQPLLAVEDYEAIGGLAASLSLHGEEILAELTPQQQHIAEIMFRRLSGTEDARQDVRRPARIEEVAKVAAAGPADVIAVAEAFARPDRCFLAAPDGPLRKDTMLDLSHESLIRQWDRLAGWATAEAKSAEMYLRLRDWAVRWKEGNADLWRGPDLAGALAWRQSETIGVEWASRYGRPEDFQIAMEFLDASDREQRATSAAQEAKRQLELRRTRRTRRVALTLGLALASLASLVIAVLAAYVWEHAAYYKEYVGIRGVPQGIGATLSVAERAHHSLSYEITTHGRSGPVIRMQLVNAAGQPRTRAGTLDAMASPGDEVANQVSRWEYAYDAQGQLVSEVLRDRDGKLIQSTLYSPPDAEPDKVHSRDAYTIKRDGSLAPEQGSCAVFSRAEYSPEGFTTRLHYLDQNGKPTPGKNRVFIKAQEYDQLGHSIRIISLWKDGRPMNDESGAAEERDRYDEAGNQVAEEAFDAAGQPIDLKRGGWQRYACTYDAHGNCVKPALWSADGSQLNSGVMGGVQQGICSWHEFRYDDRGNFTGNVCLMSDGQPPKSGLAGAREEFDEHDFPIAETWFDGAGRPAPGPFGGFRLAMAHDSDGHVIGLAFFDANGHPMLGLGGYHTKVSRFENGHEIHAEYRDQDGRLVAIEGGYAATEREFDAHGNAVRTTYIGIDGQPVPNRNEGFAIKSSSFDACGRETESEFLDEKERPAPSKNGYVHTRKTYDEANHVVEEAYFDERRRPIRSLGGYASVTREFDRNGNMTDERYFDEQGDALPAKDGAAEHLTRYDDHNSLVEEAYLGTEGELVRNKQGWAKRIRRYDGHAGLAEETYSGVNRDPVLNEDGYARAVYVNDDHGHEVEVIYFGLDGKPVIARHGYAKRISRRNDSGDILEQSYFDAGGVPVLSDGGYARQTQDLDAFGRLVGWAYFGPRNEPVIGRTEAYHRAKVVLDERGNRLELSLFGVDDKPAASMGGWARYTDRYDARNATIEEAYYGVNGEPVLIDDGYARITFTKDAHGRNTSIAYFGTDGRPVNAKNGYARTEYTYSPYGDLIEQVYFGADGKHVAGDQGYARLTQVRNAYGDIVESDCFDADDRPTYCNPRHATRVVHGYDRRRQESELILYIDGNAKEHQRIKDGKPVETSVTDSGGAPVDGQDGYSRCEIGMEWKCFDHTGRPLTEAMEIVDIARSSPAELRKGDVILSYDDGPALALDKLTEPVAEPKGQAVTLVVLRDGGRVAIQVPRGPLSIKTRKRFVPSP